MLFIENEIDALTNGNTDSPSIKRSRLGGFL